PRARRRWRCRSGAHARRRGEGRVNATLNKISTLALIALTAFTFACGEAEDANATPTVAQPDDAEAAAAAAAETATAADLSYTYNAVNRRDPFKTYFDELSQNEQQDQTNLTELQKIDLDKLKLVAVVVGTATPMAMVEDPSGRGHTVKIGTLVGKRL